jgi:hypothetical protein
MQQLDQMQQIQQIQKGGGLESASWSDYAIGGVALALLGGGFLLQTGRSLTDAYRINFGKNDSPPIPSTV